MRALSDGRARDTGERSKSVTPSEGLTLFSLFPEPSHVADGRFPIPPATGGTMNTINQPTKKPARIDVLPGIVLYQNALADADEIYDTLARELQTKQEYLTFGRNRVPMPRLTAWYGDPRAVYSYSGLANTPKPWTPALGALRERLNTRLDTTLNSCLVNVYEDGRKSIGWHADDEPELRDRIVSVSLGATRTFLLREGRTGRPQSVRLTHGSVLVMSVASQRVYQHAVPKEDASGPRTNLTFRTVTIS
jgi:alkylated DNA repair dioxygenase AlkB